jgi:hypothetical protein
MTPALLGIPFAFAGAAMLAAPQDDEGRQKAL